MKRERAGEREREREGEVISPSHARKRGEPASPRDGNNIRREKMRGEREREK